MSDQPNTTNDPSKYFDIVPGNRTSPDPSSRPLVVDNQTQDDPMVTFPEPDQEATESVPATEEGSKDTIVEAPPAEEGPVEDAEVTDSATVESTPVVEPPELVIDESSGEVAPEADTSESEPLPETPEVAEETPISAPPEVAPTDEAASKDEASPELSEDIAQDPIAVASAGSKNGIVVAHHKTVYRKSTWVLVLCLIIVVALAGLAAWKLGIK